MSSTCRIVGITSAFLLVAGNAIAQVVDISPGAFAGELQCPHKNYDAPSRSPGRGKDALEPPGGEELAALPAPNELPVQDVVLGTSNHDPSRPFSIGLWGDSHIASDHFSEEMMRVLGYSRDRVQPTFIPPTMDRSGVRLPIRKYCQSDGWSFEYAYVSRQGGGAFAKGLANLKTNTPNSYLWVDFRAQRLTLPNLRDLEILFVPPAPGEKVLLGIIVDDGAEQVVELEPGGQGIIRVRPEQPISTVKLRLIEGSLILQGFIPHYVESPAIYFDTFGIPGATGLGWKAMDAGYFRKASDDAGYDLVILEYGTNEGNDRNFDPVKYESDLRASLQNLRRVYPESLCVLIGPPDRGVLLKRVRNGKKRHFTSSSADLLKYARIHQRIGSIQEAVGKQYACSYWSWQNAMGGAGAAYRWLHHSPSLMARDLTHLTVPGYQVSARTFASDINLSRYAGKPE